MEAEMHRIRTLGKLLERLGKGLTVVGMNCSDPERTSIRQSLVTAYLLASLISPQSLLRKGSIESSISQPQIELQMPRNMRQRLRVLWLQSRFPQSCNLLNSVSLSDQGPMETNLCWNYPRKIDKEIFHDDANLVR